MADYFTNFSLVLNLANEAEQTHALDLAHRASLAQQGDELPADFPKALVDIIEDWQFETVADDSGTQHGLWLHSMYGGVDRVSVLRAGRDSDLHRVLSHHSAVELRTECGLRTRSSRGRFIPPVGKGWCIVFAMCHRCRWRV
jgi:hypothetical protein